MVRTLVFVLCCWCTAAAVAQQIPVIQWQKSLGGATGMSMGTAVERTSDGGYVIAASSSASDGDLTNNNGNPDWWIVKLNSTGDIEWQTSLGGSSLDFCYSVVQTADGGYVAAGSIVSSDGDVTGFHGVEDGWLVKLNSMGNLVWQRALGGSFVDLLQSIKTTSDSGFVVVGSSGSSDGDVAMNQGATDVWLLKLGASGLIEWEKTYGGSGPDHGKTVQLTSDGGFMITGTTSSNDGDVSGYHGISGGDIWVVKVDSIGGVQWQKALGGSGQEVGAGLQLAFDGGALITGYTNSNDGDVQSAAQGNLDVWVVKLDSAGNMVWETALGGSDVDRGADLQSTTDGGCLVLGETYSNDGAVAGNHGWTDLWIAKLDGTGLLVWQLAMGGTSADMPGSLRPTADDGWVVVGSSQSNDGDVTGNHGLRDVWFVKLGDDLTTTTAVSGPQVGTSLTLAPNPSSGHVVAQWPRHWQNVQLDVVDERGRAVMAPRLLTKESLVGITGLCPGLYFVTAKSLHGISTQQLVVE